jgi:hypothetical protein
MTLPFSARCAPLLELRVFGFGRNENRNVGVGVFPKRKEILIGRIGFGGVALQDTELRNVWAAAA